MERSKEITNALEIDTRLGPRSIDADKIVHFPRGLAGFEDEHDFVLLPIRPEAPLLILQSVHTSGVGLLVADPFSFLKDYSLVINDAEEKLLDLRGMEEAAILVTVSIPVGEPENAVLHLTGPIVINHRARLGLQIPQNSDGPGQVNMHSLKPVNRLQSEPEKQTEENAPSA
ncbi:MAG: flagellar assembly protein FliW [Desulfovibrio sp.]|jgi:flagellar assembly factor FliW|nr:flagellar assembly protein FliW [Desulfovibrio sp.]